MLSRTQAYLSVFFLKGFKLSIKASCFHVLPNTILGLDSNSIVCLPALDFGLSLLLLALDFGLILLLLALDFCLILLLVIN
jgi:hypothetical protein